MFTTFTPMTINCKGRLLDLSEPLVMGILNLTPDSFHDGGKYNDVDEILRHTEQMLTEGADIIDIGGMSSKPGSKIISIEEELKRVIEPIKAIHARFPDAILSIDTIHAEVAGLAISHGASIVNDISAGTMDEAMIPTVARLGSPYIIMHMQGTPETMQVAPSYTYVVTEVIDYLAERIRACRIAGIKDVIIDPGFGFGKNNEHNFQLLKGLSLFKILSCPILAGLSRKSMITKTLGIKNADALNGTTVLNTIALLHGASILRVHDVKEAREAVKLVKKLNMNKL
jgi:dihydropteroate synthase